MASNTEKPAKDWADHAAEACLDLFFALAPKTPELAERVRRLVLERWAQEIREHEQRS